MRHRDEERQGKCERCEVRIVWPAANLTLAKAHCHRCGGALRRTTDRIAWPVVKLTTRPLTWSEARRRFGVAGPLNDYARGI